MRSVPAILSLVLAVGCGDNRAANPDAAPAPLDAAPAPDADTTAPLSLFFSPADGAVAVLPNTTVFVFFNEDIAPATLSATSFTLTDDQGAAVSGTVASGTTGGTFTPDAALACGTRYTATVTTGVTDAAGNPLDGDVSWSFTTDPDGNGNGICDALDPCGTGPGANVAGACWFQGDWGESCSTVCQNNGLTYDLATDTAVQAGTVASGTICQDIMAALPDPSDASGCGFSREPLYGGGPVYSDHAGCVADRDSCLSSGYYIPIDRSRCDAQGPVTATAADSRIARACACH